MSANLALSAGSDNRPSLLQGLRDKLRPPMALSYLLRVSAAASLTLYLAFWLQLPTPYSAVTTVFIVANPVRGAIVSKSVWRVVGTVIGATVAVVQTAVFAQSPLLFDLFIAVWMALCCATATLLRFFPSYAAVLAGYTVVIVDTGVFADPGRALGTALFRLSVVVLGIVVCGLVFLLTQRGADRKTLESDATRCLVDVIRLLRRALAGEDVAELRATRRQLAQRITGLEQTAVYAGSDDIAVRARLAALRSAGTRLLGALTSGLHAVAEIRPRADIASVFGDTLAEVETLASKDRNAARARLDAGARALEALQREDHALPLLAAIEQARDTVDRLGRTVDDLNGIVPEGGPARFRPFLDWRSAFRNGLRGFITVMLAALAWYITYAPAGPSLLAYLVPASALTSTAPSPGVASLRFAQGTVVATIIAVICQSMVLPQTTGFPLVAGTLVLFASPGVVLQLSPKWGGLGFAYLVFFNTQLSLQNPMNFNLTELLNNAEMYLLGSAALLITFGILLPPDPARAARNIARSLSAAASRLARTRTLPRPLTWENVQLQKILQFGLRLDAMGTAMRGALMEEAAAALILGRIVLQLRRMLAGGTLPAASRDAVEAGLASLARLRHRPLERAVEVDRHASEAVGDAEREEALRGPGQAEALREPGQAEALRAGALMHEAARLLSAHAAFFDRNTAFEHVVV